MKRVLVMLLGLGLVAACAFVVASSLNDSDSDEADVIVMPYPRTTKPLPVPEVRIGTGPWADPLTEPTPVEPLPLPPGAPEQVPTFAEGVTCTSSHSHDAKGQGGMFRACRTTG